VLFAVVALGGCGFGPGPGTGAVSLTVSQGFGGHRLARVTEAHVPGSETVMQLLERHLKVGTRYGGGFVESIDGHSGTSDQKDWFYYVNGVEAPKGAASTAVHKDDHIWFDLHDWQATDSIPAVVGSFPEPFTNGVAGKRYPVTLGCGATVQSACQRIASEFSRYHVPAASELLGTGSGTDTLSVNIGTWPQLAREIVAAYIQHGPGSSGVYARFTQGGSRLQLLNPQGKVVRTLGPGAGLIAATSAQSSVPTWLVTGTDPAGVQAAARALNPAALADHFALAVQGRQLIPVPVTGG
jgi:hypothetical protein